MDTADLIQQGLAGLDLPAPAGASGRMARFLELLEKWNRTRNLTAITGPEAMVAKHVLDSLAGAPWVRGRRILDVGSGAGLPGIPLAIADPSRQWVLLDSRGKRTQFLNYVRHDLGLANVTVVQARIEKYQPEGKFDTLTARAFAALPKLVGRVMPFITSGARLVAWQGGDPSAELAETLAGRNFVYAVHGVQVPGIQAQRHIAIVERGE